MSTGKHTVDHPENRIQVQSIHKTQNQKAAAEESEAAASDSRAKHAQ
ncbi:MAG: hypothetical protein P8P70_00520 [Sulfitobacter sp.]|nr:hypothetical protein [Sulfitobacter sp.]